MFGRSFPSFARRHLGWLLCLALLLPLAQLAGSAHALSHLPQSTQIAHDEDQGEPALHHCPLCPLASVVGGGALPPAPASLALAALPAATPAVSADPAPATAPARLFRIRGPPLA